MVKAKNDQPTFDNLGLADSLLKILTKQGYVTPTPIQHQCIPQALEGKDIVGIAQTGTGKTLAFGLPMIQRLATSKGQGLIVLPTRELAIQVDEVLAKIGRDFGLRTAILIGGAPIRQQISQLQRNPHIVIGTPGRIIDHLQQHTYNLGRTSIVVMDEADRMFDIGFVPQIKQILSQATGEQQTLMFSATMPPAISEIAAKFMKLPLRIEVAPAGTPAANVEQEVFIVSKDAKIQLLNKFLYDSAGTVLVFSRTKHGAKKITQKVIQMGHTAVEIHSNRSLGQRRDAMAGFKSGKYRVLVATDIAARGIDVNDIELVINYDLPDNPEDYVHRIGRTGRAGKTGKAISFASPDQKGDIKQIERLIKKTLPILNLPNMPKMAGAESFNQESREYDARRPARSFQRGAPRRESGYTSRSARPSFGGSRSERPAYGSARPAFRPARAERPAFNAGKPEKSAYASARTSFAPKAKISYAKSAAPDLWVEKRPRSNPFGSETPRKESSFASDKKPYAKKAFASKPKTFGNTPFAKKTGKPRAKRVFVKGF